MKSSMYRSLTVWILGVLLCCLTAIPALAETPEEPTAIETLYLVVEDEDIPEYVYHYVGKEKVDHGTFTWVGGGVKGNALQLNGENQYVRLATAEVKELSSFTFSAWVNRAPSKQEEADGSKLLTVYKNENRYLSLSLDKQDTEKGINGICLELQDRAIDPITLFRPASDEVNTALPTNKWHHIAVTFSDTEIAVYIDGSVYLQQALDLSVDEMDLRTFIVGGGFYGETPLNAMLDNVLVFNAPLSAKQIALLAQNSDPLSNASPTTTTEVLATAPATLPDKIVTTEPQTGLRVLGLPLGLVVILATFIIIAVVLSIVFTRHNKQEESDHL